MWFNALAPLRCLARLMPEWAYRQIKIVGARALDYLLTTQVAHLNAYNLHPHTIAPRVQVSTSGFILCFFG
jgi:hypothetical protein